MASYKALRLRCGFPKTEFELLKKEIKHQLWLPNGRIILEGSRRWGLLQSRDWLDSIIDGGIGIDFWGPGPLNRQSKNTKIPTIYGFVYGGNTQKKLKPAIKGRAREKLCPIATPNDTAYPTKRPKGRPLLSGVELPSDTLQKPEQSQKAIEKAKAAPSDPIVLDSDSEGDSIIVTALPDPEPARIKHHRMSSTMSRCKQADRNL